MNSESIEHFQNTLAPFADGPPGSNLGYLNTDIRATAGDADSSWKRGKS